MLKPIAEECYGASSVTGITYGVNMRFFEQENGIGILFSENEGEIAIGIIDSLVETCSLKINEETALWVRKHREKITPLTDSTH